MSNGASAVGDDLFDFTTGTAALRLDDGVGGAVDLPPLEAGAEDVLGDRGVIIKRRTPPTSRKSPLASERYRFVELHYDAFVPNGEMFDSSKDQNYPAIVELDLPPTDTSTVVRAWEAALQKVRAGEVITLYANSRYAYGKDGDASGVVPPDSDIRYEITVIDVRCSKKVVVVEGRTTEGDERSRLDAIRLEREIAAERRAAEKDLKEKNDAARKAKAAELKEKLDAKRAASGQKGKKKKSKK